jgi:hypothetical protein
MAAPTITIYRGEYRQELITITDEATDAPVDLTGSHLSLSVWKRLEDVDPAFAPKETDVGIVHSDQNSAPGQAIVTFDPVDTLTMPVDVAQFVVWIRDAAGDPQVAIPPSPFVVREAKAPAAP